MIGSSPPSTSTTTLSIPNPDKADIKCSIVESWSSPEHSDVAIWVLPTPDAQAGKLTPPGKSVRLKTIPESTSAGCKLRFTLRPVCRATPVALILFLRVCCRFAVVNAYSLSCHNASLVRYRAKRNSQPITV